MKKFEKIISTMPEGYGQQRITISYYGKEISAHYTCMAIFDKWRSGERGWKTAAANIYDYVVIKNSKQ